MSSIICPIQCVKSGCDQKDFLEKHSAFVLTLGGIAISALTMMFTYFLKSRCRKVKCLCFSCDRDVLDPKDMKTVDLKSAHDEEEEVVIE